MTVRYAINKTRLQVGYAPRDWGLGLLIDSREFEVAVGPFFVWLVLR